MPPKRKCSCKEHDQFSKDFFGNMQVLRNDGKRIKKELTECLVDQGHLSARATYLCTACINYAENHLICHEKDTNQHVKAIIHDIKNSTFTTAELCQIAAALGSSQSAAVMSDIQSVSKAFRDDSVLKNFKASEWISQRNNVVVSFLEGLSGPVPPRPVHVAKAVDSIYYVRNPQYVAPLAFAQSLLLYFESGSKNAVNINCAGNPAGSYGTICNFIKSLPCLECPRKEDVVTFFDNNQVIERKWHVEANYKSRSSVSTTCIHLTTSEATRLQDREELSPKHWFQPIQDSTEMKEKILHWVDSQQANFKQFRNKFITRMIEKMQKGENLTDTAEKRYTYIDSNHQFECRAQMGEVILENPCSLESVEKVLDELTGRLFRDDRKWTVLGCDGLPYNLGYRVIEGLHVCPTCKREFLSASELQQHSADWEHELDPKLCRKFDNLIILPGLGHYEINMVKALFKLLWDVGLDRLGSMLGFLSPKAQMACQNASDHHKSWEILQIFTMALGSELLVPYIEYSKAKHELPTAEGFFEWVPLNNDQFTYLVEVIFTYCVGLQVFRAGVRRNNSEAINAAKAMFAPLFYGLHMPFYMETFVRDVCIRLQCPPEVLAFIENHESYSISGSDCKGEGGDFVLESKNKDCKRLLPPGLPDGDQWIRSARNVEWLTEIELNTKTQLYMSNTTDPNYAYVRDLSEEISQFKKIIREEKFVTSPKIVGLSGTPLNSDLRHFNHLCNDNFKIFLSEVCQNGLANRVRLQRLAITESQRVFQQSYESMTKAELGALVEEKIDSEATYQRWIKVKRGRKEGYIAFLRELDKCTCDN